MCDSGSDAGFGGCLVDELPSAACSAATPSAVPLCKVARLLTLKPVAREFQGAAVLRDRTDDMVWNSSRNLRVDLKRDPH